MTDSILIPLSGRIDSNNAALVESQMLDRIAGSSRPLILDASDLSYISSAGLRVLLKIKKSNPEMSIVNVNSDVYEILEMTGFTEMITIEKAYKTVSIEGCEVIGQGANGTIYRIDKDNVVKVYNNADALGDIKHEREVARLALILGIPTAISYDVVKVGNSYGSVFELLNARSFSKILVNEPDKFEWCVEEYVNMLKKIHGTLVPAGKLPDMKATAIRWASFMKDYLPEKYFEKLYSLVDGVPRDDHMIHGDYHTKNLELQNDEVLIIDMDTLAVGHPVFELASMYNSFVGFSEFDHSVIERFQGFDLETGRAFWRRSLELYLGTSGEEKIRAVEDKARIIGYTRMIRRSIRRGGLENERTAAEISLWKTELMELLDRVDTLTFLRNDIEIEAVKENLDAVIAFIEHHLESIDCGPKARMQICMAAEEIFVNIANYAYAPDKGRAKVSVEVTDQPLTVVITFVDNGRHYDPLAKEDPDVTLPASERQIGGLGVFLVKQTMDDVVYEYKDGKNILKLKKNI